MNDNYQQQAVKSTPVIFTEKTCQNGKILAYALLNSPQSLNALSLSMINLLLTQFKNWLDNDQVVVIIIEGNGSKAFCAGGDVVSIYHDLVARKNKYSDGELTDKDIVASNAYQFFRAEYQLDLLIHQATKPILALAQGYVMGGGLGLMVGASHRIATDNTLLAMPEVTIGLYPDVGASWFLNQMPQGLGLFLGLTGCFFNGEDGHYLGLIDNVLDNQSITAVLNQMQQVDWQDNQQLNHQLLTALLSEHSDRQKNQSIKNQSVKNQSLEKPSITLEQYTPLIQQLTNFDNIVDIYHAIVTYSSDQIWFKKAQQKLLHGSPLSAHIIHQQLKNSRGCSLEDCFKQEFKLSLRHCQHSEFIEGVRALLVDKDNKPKWQYAGIAQVEQSQVEWFFN